ncbi:MAG: hypothetical protein Q4D96_08625, partial [Propionibacteriaceae bacterium]|nr:hypothetical protein [Propionibacteriaceae bacterium]
MSNSQWSGPGGPGFPQGQPPQGYQQPGYQSPQGYPQHGMPQGQPPYGQPPKSNTGLVIALARHLTQVLSIDEQTAVVQPGVVQ